MKQLWRLTAEGRFECAYRGFVLEVEGGARVALKAGICACLPDSAKMDAQTWKLTDNGELCFVGGGVESLIVTIKGGNKTSKAHLWLNTPKAPRKAQQWAFAQVDDTWLFGAPAPAAVAPNTSRDQELRRLIASRKEAFEAHEAHEARAAALLINGMKPRDTPLDRAGTPTHDSRQTMESDDNLKRLDDIEAQFGVKVSKNGARSGRSSSRYSRFDTTRSSSPASSVRSFSSSNSELSNPSLAQARPRIKNTCRSSSPASSVRSYASSSSDLSNPSLAKVRPRIKNTYRSSSPASSVRSYASSSSELSNPSLDQARPRTHNQTSRSLSPASSVRSFASSCSALSSRNVTPSTARAAPMHSESLENLIQTNEPQVGGAKDLTLPAPHGQVEDI